MNSTGGQNEETWGVRINTGWWGSAEGWPAWANPLQREKWREHGLVLWDHQEQQIVRLSADLALQLLDHLRTTDDWREHGFTVGEPATKLVLREPDRKPKPVLLYGMTLSPDQVQRVFDLLVRKEPDLESLREAGAEDRKRRLSRVYTILLDLAALSEQENESGAIEEGE